MSKIYFQKPSSWSSAYAYVYSSTDINIRNSYWHGVQMTNLGNGLFSYDVPNSVGINPYVVFNDGGSVQYPLAGGLQITSDSMILYTSNTWTIYNLGTSTPSTVTSSTTTIATSTITVDNSSVVEAINLNNSLLYCFIVMFFVVLAWYFFYKVIKIFV